MKNNRKIIIVLIILVLILGLFYLINNTKEEEKITNYNKNNYFIEPIERNNSKIINLELEAKKSNIEYEGRNIEMYSYNNMTPGPIIRAQKGDTINVTLKNSLDEPTTIHWHGLQVPNNMDGVPDITQNSVLPKNNFTYTFTLNQTGTYWYHPHTNTPKQVGMGLYGIIIVDDKNKTQTYDQRNLMVLDDVRLSYNDQIPSFGNMHDQMMSGRYGSNYFINGEKIYNFSAEKNSLLKLHFVNTANARIFNILIEDKRMLVVKKDINSVEKPYEVNSLILAPGERAEVIVNLNNDTDEDVLDIINIASQNIDNTIGKINLEDSNISLQNQKYQNMIKEDRTYNLTDFSDKINQSPNATYNLYSKRGNMEVKWTINGKTYPENPETINLEESKFYKFKYVNKQNMVHPMHLHGQKFQILKRSRNQEINNEWKDTVLVYPGETLEIGFIAEGSGSWVNHCHILEHSEAGMLMKVNIK